MMAASALATSFWPPTKPSSLLLISTIIKGFAYAAWTYDCKVLIQTRTSFGLAGAKLGPEQCITTSMSALTNLPLIFACLKAISMWAIPAAKWSSSTTTFTRSAVLFLKEAM